MFPDMPNLTMEPQLQQVERASTSNGDDIFAQTLRELEEFENQSGSDNPAKQDAASGDDQTHRKRKRHTQHQIQEMETFFKDNPHPHDTQRKELGRLLGLEPLQVKFWFQNKRTQIKTQVERSENSQLRSENEKLRSDNIKYKEALNNLSCPNCGGPAVGGPAVGEISSEEHLRMENSHLRQEEHYIARISAMAAKQFGNVGSDPQTSYPIPVSPPVTSQPHEIGFEETFGGEMLEEVDIFKSIRGLPVRDEEKPIIIEVAIEAMDELIKMAQMGAPLWLAGGIDGSTTVLNEEEYFKAFPKGSLGVRPNGFKCEASRESAIVILNQTSLVEILMNVNQWPIMFAGIVSKAMRVEVISTGVAGSFDGAIQVMTAEFQMPSPFVPTRESYFVRYCKNHAEGIWAIVDVSLEDLIPGPPTKCRRRPSGCLIQEMPNGCSKVTWIEHVEVETEEVHNLYKPLIHSGLAFGAKRWICTLVRRCQRLASAMATTVPTSDLTANIVITNPEGRKGILKVADRMVLSLFAVVSSSTKNVWTVIPGSAENAIRVMTKKNIVDVARPSLAVLNAATSFWLPVPPNRIFGFLCDENRRTQWDILSTNGVIEEAAYIAIGPQPGNSVSLFHVHRNVNSCQSKMLILQESFSDPTGSYVIYAPVDISAMNAVLGGGDPANVALIPSGFAILPDGPISQKVGVTGESGSGGSLVTLVFQIQVDTTPNTQISSKNVATVNELVTSTVKRLRAAIV